MKKYYTLILITIFSANVFAGTGGPDLYGYTWKDSNEPTGPVYNWIDIDGIPGATSIKLLGDDNSRGPFAMNFGFHYYWYDVSQFWVGSNGYLLFQDGQIASPFYTFPSALLPNDVLGVFENDLSFLNANNPGTCWYWVNPAQDTLIVSWLNVPFFDIVPEGFSGSNTFQVILSAVDSSITYQYNQVDASNPVQFSQSNVGMENYAGNLGLQWPAPFSLQSPNDNFAIKFYYPHPVLATNITDATVLNIDNPSTGAIFGITNSTPYNFTGTIKNYSTHTVNPFNVFVKFSKPGGNFTSENFTVDTLTSTQSVNVTFSTQLQTDTAGTYKFSATTQLAGDNVASNNSKKLEIVVLDTTLTEMWMGYDNGANNSNYALNWIGGSGGAGNYYIPPFYPIAITKLHYFIAAAGPTDAFIARVYDDDGVLGLPFTLLDSEYVAQPNIIVNGWNEVVLPAPIIINSGGFYLGWDEVGSTISLGCTTNDPISNRSYEEFENVWGIYRNRETQDPMIAATVEKASFPTGIAVTAINTISLSVFPNPASDQLTLLYNTTNTKENNSLAITDLHGKLINTLSLGRGSGSHKLTLDVNSLPAGIYFAVLINGKEKTVQKLVITD